MEAHQKGLCDHVSSSVEMSHSAAIGGNEDERVSLASIGSVPSCCSKRVISTHDSSRPHLLSDINTCCHFATSAKRGAVKQVCGDATYSSLVSVQVPSDLSAFLSNLW